MWLAHFNKIVLQVAEGVLHAATFLTILQKEGDSPTFLAAHYVTIADCKMGRYMYMRNFYGKIIIN